MKPENKLATAMVVVFISDIRNQFDSVTTAERKFIRANGEEVSQKKGNNYMDKTVNIEQKIIHRKLKQHFWKIIF